jgi:serine/threonine protein kinase
MIGTSPCPKLEDLQHFLLGQMAEAEAEQVELHLAWCPGCIGAAHTLPGKDTLVDAVREGGKADTENIEIDEALIARLCQLRQADQLQELQKILAPPQGPGEIGRLGAYRVLKLLGAGGMGVVFQAEDPSLRRLVALKVMKPAVAVKAEARQRFLREARAAAAVKHDHIVTIYQVVDDPHVPFLAMELLEGEALEDRLKREGKLPPADVLCLGRAIAEGLAAAHERGLIHRDIKPANIWLETLSGISSEPRPSGSGLAVSSLTVAARAYRVKILDFGLARTVGHEDAHLTQPSMILGTPAYMAPEQARPGAVVDARCDLFSLGCVLYRMTTGAEPFQGTTAINTLVAVAHDNPMPPCEVNPEVPPALSDLVMRLLAKDPADRPASARAVAEALAALERSPAGTARTPRRRWVAAAAAVIGLAAGGMLAAQIILRITDQEGKTRDVPIKGGDKIEIVQQHDGPDQKRGDALRDKDNPFLLVRAGDQKSEEFKDLATALNALRDGDAIEVHGNGPFRVGRVRLRGTNLILRAAPGYRPRFVPDDTVPGPANPKRPAWFAIQGAGLSVAGCDFCGRPTTASPDDFDCFEGGGAPWEFHSCRFVACAYLGSFSASKLTIADSLIYANHQGWIAPKTELHLTNNIIVCTHTPMTFLAPGGQSVHLTNNTIALATMPELGLFNLSYLAKDSQPVSIKATGNLFAFAGLPVGKRFLFSNKDWVKVAHWKGGQNLYADPDKETRLPDGPEQGSRTVEFLYFLSDDVRLQAAEVTVAKLRRVTDDMRRQKGLADLGPDWDLIGAGPAYARALEAEGKPVAKGRLRPAPPVGGPFVVWREDKSARGYATLQEAVTAAGGGDTVEIRTDDEYLWLPHIRADFGALTIRAAPGYRPVLQGRLEVDRGNVLSFEGIAFYKAGLFPARDTAGCIARLANCSFEAPTYWALDARFQTRDGRPAEIVNCLIPQPVVISLPPQAKLALRNSVVGWADVRLLDEGECRLDLDRCAVWHSYAKAHWACALRVTGEKGKLALTARRTVFEAGAGLLNPSYRELHLVSRWSGSHNVYRVGNLQWVPFGFKAVNLAGWKQYWHSPEEGSVEADPWIYDPLMWRVRPQSPGSKSGPDGKDFGADIHRVATTAAAAQRPR